MFVSAEFCFTASHCNNPYGKEKPGAQANPAGHQDSDAVPCTCLPHFGPIGVACPGVVFFRYMFWEARSCTMSILCCSFLDTTPSALALFSMPSIWSCCLLSLAAGDPLVDPLLFRSVPLRPFSFRTRSSENIRASANVLEEDAGKDR